MLCLCDFRHSCVSCHIYCMQIGCYQSLIKACILPALTRWVPPPVHSRPMKKDKLRVKAMASLAIKRKKEVQGPQVQLQSYDPRLRLKQAYGAKQCGRGVPPMPCLSSSLQAADRLSELYESEVTLHETSSTSGCLRTPGQSETLREIPGSWGSIVPVVW